jgi:peptidoglycan/xylan/chitin deacetylase (PgdA/CDA1 family)
MWKNNAKCAVCLTFDCDSDISWKNIMRRTGAVKEGEPFSPVVLSQGQYEVNVAIPRILKFLDKHELKGCFFVPGMLAEDQPGLVKDIDRKGHEIGHHGYSHLNPARLTPEQEMQELEKGLRALEGLLDKKPKGYRAPAFDLSPRTLEYLCNLGFLYESSMMAWDIPYIHHVREKKLVEIPFNWLTVDWTYFAFNFFPPLEYQSGISSQEEVLEIWTEEFEGLYDERGLFTLVMHPQAIGRASRMRMLDRLINHIKKKNGVWITTPSQIAEYWLETYP